jgi:hypothetical protein
MPVQVRPEAPYNILEEYPSPVEGDGLENRKVEKSAQGFESLFLRQKINIAGWSSLVARWAHNPKVVGSNPAPATKMVPWCSGYHARLSRERSRVQFPSEPPYGFIAQSVEHKTENLGVVGSIPTEATKKLITPRGFVPIAQLDRAFDYGSKG